MINNVKVFVKDYGELMKHEVKFYKTHWKGVVITQLVLFGGVATAGAVYTINQEKKYEKRKRYEKKKNKEVDVEYEVEKEE